MNYDTIAHSYDRRYDRNDHTGVEQTLLAFLRGSVAAIEVGCGTGHWLSVLGRQPAHPATIGGVDESWGMLAQAREKKSAAYLVQGRAEMLPFEAASFDRVFCIHALHHFHDKRAFIASARRVLRPGGGLLTLQLDPHVGGVRWWIYDFFPEARPVDRERYPSGTVIRSWMTDAGFTSCQTVLAQHLDLSHSAEAALAQGAADRTATSQLALLSEEAYASGMVRLQSAIDGASARGGSLSLAVDLRLFGTTCWVK